MQTTDEGKLSGMELVYSYEIENRKWAIEQACRNLAMAGSPARTKDIIAGADEIYGFITGTDASAKLQDIDSPIKIVISGAKAVLQSESIDPQ